MIRCPVMRVSLFASLVGLLVPVYPMGVALAEEPRLPPAELDGVQPARDGGHRARQGSDQAYGGVAPGPGSNVKPPYAPKRKNPARVTWTGFQPLEQGGGRVFVELTEEVPYQVLETAHGLTVQLKGVRLHVRNHRLPLETAHFGTPVSRVAVRERGGTVTLDIATRGKVTHAERVETQDGYRFLMVDVTNGQGTNDGLAGAPAATQP